MLRTALLIIAMFVVSGCSKPATDVQNASDVEGAVLAKIDKLVSLLEAEKVEEFFGEYYSPKDLEKMIATKQINMKGFSESEYKDVSRMLGDLKKWKAATPQISDDNQTVWFCPDKFSLHGEVAFSKFGDSWYRARQPPPSPRRLQIISERENLRQLTMAMFTFEKEHRSFPAHAIYSEDGSKPLLSWRVQLLPYLGQTELYEQFRKDEPWDSEHNMKLLEKIPEVFIHPNLEATVKTVYLAVSGSESMMNGSSEPRRIRSISDGATNTIMFVEVDEDFSQPWTKPADFDFDPENPKKGLGNIRDGGFHAAMCDGSVRLVENSIDKVMLKWFFRINDGQIVDKSLIH